jgi:hypothetical protein
MDIAISLVPGRNPFYASCDILGTVISGSLGYFKRRLFLIPLNS